MNLIVAADANWAIGKDGDQLCYIRADLKRFQALTKGHGVILGRRTLATFPGGKPLKNRENIILSAQEGFTVEGAVVCASLEAALAAAPPDSFVLGGESVYRQALPYCERAYVTKIHKAFPADRYFPDLDQSPDWEIETQEGPFLEEGLRFTYVTYHRRGGRISKT